MIFQGRKVKGKGRETNTGDSQVLRVKEVSTHVKKMWRTIQGGCWQIRTISSAFMETCGKKYLPKSVFTVTMSCKSLIHYIIQNFQIRDFQLW